MKRALVLAVCLTFIAGGGVLAEAGQQRYMGSQRCVGSRQYVEPQKHIWELGTEISYINYEETDVMREKGLMYGVLGSYAYHKNLMLKLEGRFSFGWVDYSSPTSGTLNNIRDYMLEFRGLTGYDFPLLKATTFTPYIGLGYRYLNDDSSQMITSEGNWGYEREISYFYSPIGVEMITALNTGWSIGLILEYDHFWNGTVKSHVGYVTGYNIKNNQNEGYGCRGSVKFKKKGKGINYLIEPFVRYWDIKDSKITEDPLGILWMEPRNNSTEFGVKLGVEF